jgi:hypothetical protein
VAGGREDVAERRPQPQRAVADRHHRRLHLAAPQVAQDLGPAVGGLPLPLSHGHQLLGAVGAHAHDHQAAQPGLLQPNPEVDIVGPDVDAIAVGEVTSAKRPHSRRTPPTPGRSRRSTAQQVQQRQHLSHLGTLAAPRRQDDRPEADPLAAHQVSATVVHPWRAHLHPTRGGQHLARAGVAVAHHQPPATLIPLGGVGGQGGVDLGLQGGGEHPPGALAHQLVHAQAQLVMRLGIGDYTQHAAFLPRRRSPRRRFQDLSSGKVRRTHISRPDPQLQVIARASPAHRPIRSDLASRGGPPRLSDTEAVEGSAPPGDTAGSCRPGHATAATGPAGTHARFVRNAYNRFGVLQRGACLQAGKRSPSAP